MTGFAPSPAAIDHRSFGDLLRAWRNARAMSQLALSGRASVSTRHLSYLETGRARPSREMVVLLAQAFEMPLRDRNAFLQAAGFAPMYRETPLHARPMGPVRDAVDLLLHSTEPNPTFVLNRRADIVEANEAGQWLVATFNEDLGSFARPYNIGRLLLSPKGERAYIENWEQVARLALARLRRELGGAHLRDSADEELLKTIDAAWAEVGDPPHISEPLPLLITVRFRRGDLALNLFSIHASLGTQLDVTLQELRVEMFFPADEQSKRVLEGRMARAPTRPVTQDIVEAWRREAVQEGVEQGIKHGLLEVYEARFGAMPEDLRTVVEDTDDEPALVAWVRLAGTRSADEIAAAIRSFRAS